MDFIQFTLPQTTGETLAWLVALGSFLIGIGVMLAPRVLMSIVGLQATAASGTSEVRAIFGGMMGGLGLACLLLSPQPLLYFALGLAFFFAVIGRIISLAADRALSGVVWAGLLLEVAGAFFPLSYTFGIIS